MNLTDLITIAGAIGTCLAALSLGYSVYALLRTRRGAANERGKTSSISLTPVSTKNFALELLALQDPEVRRLLAQHPDAVSLQVMATSGTPPGKYEATLIAQGAEGEARLSFDLKQRTDLVGLIRAMQAPGVLAKGGRKWRKTNRRRESLHQRPNLHEDGGVPLPAQGSRPAVV